jgi:hypothetical protein
MQQTHRSGLRSQYGLLPKTQVYYTDPEISTKRLVFVESVMDTEEINNRSTVLANVVFSYEIKQGTQNDDDDDEYVKTKLGEVVNDTSHYVTNPDYIQELIDFILENKKQEVTEFLEALSADIRSILFKYENIYMTLANAYQENTNREEEGYIAYDDLLSLLFIPYTS